MGATIVKLVHEDSIVEQDGDVNRDPELGVDDDSTTWDSSTSSECDTDEYEKGIMCTCEYHRSGAGQADKYLVEKRFVAESNSYFYEIAKRK